MKGKRGWERVLLAVRMSELYDGGIDQRHGQMVSPDRYIYPEMTESLHAYYDSIGASPASWIFSTPRIPTSCASPLICTGCGKSVP